MHCELKSNKCKLLRKSVCRGRLCVLSLNACSFPQLTESTHKFKRDYVVFCLQTCWNYGSLLEWWLYYWNGGYTIEKVAYYWNGGYTIGMVAHYWNGGYTIGMVATVLKRWLTIGMVAILLE